MRGSIIPIYTWRLRGTVGEARILLRCGVWVFLELGLIFLYPRGTVGVGVLGGFGLVVCWGVALLYVFTR